MWKLYLQLLTLAALAAIIRADNLAWERVENFRSAPLKLSAPGKTGFTQLDSRSTGLIFTNQVSELLALNNQILENGAGIALGDVDGDGWCDIYLCGAENSNKLFRNLGNWTFTDITEAAGVACAGQFSTGAVLVDIDGDGDLDLLVNGLGAGTRCFLNDGHGHFTEDNQSGLNRNSAATSMALADLDGDGDLDLYVTNYRVLSARNDPALPAPTARIVNGKVVLTPADRFSALLRVDGSIELVEKGEPDALYLNNGKGKFSPVSWTQGAFVDEQGKPLPAPPEDWGLSVILRDLNSDGTPDIYVCNDFFRSRDRLWLNNGRGQFRAISPLAWRCMPLSSMSVDVADINRDGHDDFIAVEMLSRDHRVRQYQRANAMKPEMGIPVSEPSYQPELLRNTLQLARGDGTFAEIAYLAGLAATDWSWSAVFLDVDLDGWEDLLVATGNAHDVLDLDAQNQIDRAGPRATQPALRFYPRLEQPNLAFRNRHDLTFEEVGQSWGFNQRGISQALAMADLDNDGDLDLVVSNLNAETWLLRNDTATPRVAVRLKGTSPNTAGVGARIRVGGGPVEQSQIIEGGGRYLSSDDAIRVFAAGRSTNLQIEVDWPNGRHSLIAHAQPNRIYEVFESSGSTTQTRGSLASPPLRKEKTNETTFLNSVAAPPAPLFEDVSELIHHLHADEPFDDFVRQPLLPNQLSQLGPGISWFDVNGDGWDDLIVPSGKGGQLAVFQNNAQGKFVKADAAALRTLIARDQTTVLGWSPARGQSILLAGSANYEDGLAIGPVVRQFNLGANRVDDATPPSDSSAGPLALADIDGDGDLDLFVGGRVISGRYPEPASSLLFLNVDGLFVPDVANSPRLAHIGLVSGAVFSDLNGDGFPELVLACEWGPVRVFMNERGRFHDATAELGLSGWSGLWNGVATGDFDGDGRLDIVASNWGRNTHRVLPWRIYFGDFAGNQQIDVIEAFSDSTSKKIVPWRARDVIARSLPGLVEQFPTHRAFAQASIAELLGEKLRAARVLEVTTLDSMVFLNRGAKFEAKSLPVEAQFSPAFGIVVADFDGDSKEDLFLAQNFFGAEPETSRSDAGRGLLLRGLGTGAFKAEPGQWSGLKIYGEQRGAAVADYDRDGRVDLAVAQNRGATKLYRNARATPGLRVRVRGPEGNPAGVGTMARLKFGARFGPAREIHAGSGYWSQDSATIVLATPEAAGEIELRLPGGKMVRSPLPADAKEISIDGGGRVEIVR